MHGIDLTLSNVLDSGSLFRGSLSFSFSQLLGKTNYSKFKTTFFFSGPQSGYRFVTWPFFIFSQSRQVEVFWKEISSPGYCLNFFSPFLPFSTSPSLSFSHLLGKTDDWKFETITILITCQQSEDWFDTPMCWNDTPLVNKLYVWISRKSRKFTNQGSSLKAKVLMYTLPVYMKFE